MKMIFFYVKVSKKISLNFDDKRQQQPSRTATQAKNVTAHLFFETCFKSCLILPQTPSSQIHTLTYSKHVPKLFNASNSDAENRNFGI